MVIRAGLVIMWCDMVMMWDDMAVTSNDVKGDMVMWCITWGHRVTWWWRGKGLTHSS